MSFIFIRSGLSLFGVFLNKLLMGLVQSVRMGGSLLNTFNMFKFVVNAILFIVFFIFLNYCFDDLYKFFFFLLLLLYVIFVLLFRIFLMFGDLSLSVYFSCFVIRHVLMALMSER